MAEGSLPDRVRAKVERLRQYGEDLSRREQEYLLRAAEIAEKEQRLESVRTGLRTEAERLKAQRGEQDGFEQYLTDFFEREGAAARRADESYRDFVRRAAGEILRRKEAEGEQGRVIYETPAGMAITPPQGPELQKPPVTIITAKRIPDETLGIDFVSVRMEGKNLRKRIILKDPEHIGYYNDALRFMKRLPGVEVDADPKGKYVELYGPIEPVKVFYKAIATKVEAARGGAEIDSVLERLER